MILLDTCALIDLVSTKATLSAKTLDLLDENAVILSISFAELACKVEAKKLILEVSVDDLLTRIQGLTRFTIQDITSEMWLQAIRLDWRHEGKAHKDPADRLILSYAERHKLMLATTDHLMKSRYARCVW